MEACPPGVAPPPREPAARDHAEVVQQRRGANAQRFAVVKGLQVRGPSGQAIMRETAISRGTWRKWRCAGELPPAGGWPRDPGWPKRIGSIYLAAGRRVSRMADGCSPKSRCWGMWA